MLCQIGTEHRFRLHSNLRGNSHQNRQGIDRPQKRGDRHKAGVAGGGEAAAQKRKEMLRMNWCYINCKINCLAYIWQYIITDLENWNVYQSIS
jgi:hypothetical protein